MFAPAVVAAIAALQLTAVICPCPAVSQLNAEQSHSRQTTIAERSFDLRTTFRSADFGKYYRIEIFHASIPAHYPLPTQSRGDPSRTPIFSASLHATVNPPVAADQTSAAVTISVHHPCRPPTGPPRPSAPPHLPLTALTLRWRRSDRRHRRRPTRRTSPERRRSPWPVAAAATGRACGSDGPAAGGRQGQVRLGLGKRRQGWFCIPDQGYTMGHQVIQLIPPPMRLGTDRATPRTQHFKHRAHPVN